MFSLTKFIAAHRQKLARIRREVDAGAYETEHKLDVTADILLDKITAEMRRDARREQRLSRREELRIPWEQELRARLLTGHTRPRD